MMPHAEGGYHQYHIHIESYRDYGGSELEYDRINRLMKEVAGVNEQDYRTRKNIHRVQFMGSTRMFECTCWGLGTKKLWCSHVERYFTEGEVIKDLAKHMTNGGKSFSAEFPIAGGWGKTVAECFTYEMSKLTGNPDDKDIGLSVHLREMDGIEVWLEPKESAYKVIRVADDWLRAHHTTERLLNLNQANFDIIECNSIRHRKNFPGLLEKKRLAQSTNSTHNFIMAEALSLHRHKKCTMCSMPVNVDEDIPRL